MRSKKRALEKACVWKSVRKKKRALSKPSARLARNVDKCNILGNFQTLWYEILPVFLTRYEYVFLAFFNRRSRASSRGSIFDLLNAPNQNLMSASAPGSRRGSRPSISIEPEADPESYAQYGGINPSLYLNPEQFDKEEVSCWPRVVSILNTLNRGHTLKVTIFLVWMSNMSGNAKTRWIIE